MHRVRLGKYKRDSESLAKECENLQALWSPDSKLIAVLNTHLSFDLNISGGYFEVFKNTHLSESWGWITERVKEDYEQMIKIHDARLSKVPEGSELDSDAEKEIYSQVLSSEMYEKYGFKRGISHLLRKVPQARKSRGSGYEKFENEVQENKRRISNNMSLFQC